MHEEHSKIFSQFITSTGKCNSQQAKNLKQHRGLLEELTPNCKSENLQERLYWVYTEKEDYVPEDYWACLACGKQHLRVFSGFVKGYRASDKIFQKEYCDSTCRFSINENVEKSKGSKRFRCETAEINNMHEIVVYLRSNLFRKNGTVNSNLVRDLHPDFSALLRKFVSPKLESNDPTEQIYWIMSDLQDYPKKCYCGKPIKKFRAFSYDLHDFCSIKCMQSDENIRKKTQNTNLIRYGGIAPLNSDAIKEKSKITCRERYGVDNPSQDPEIFDKIIKGQMKWKTYTFPSGRTTRIQGYEDRALDKLLETHHEDNIVTHKGVPTFDYEVEGQKHRYFPDIYIKSTNTIVEVKSEWTLKMQKNNEEKFQAVRDAGYEFQLMVF